MLKSVSCFPPSVLRPATGLCATGTKQRPERKQALPFAEAPPLAETVNASLSAADLFTVASGKARARTETDGEENDLRNLNTPAIMDAKGTTGHDRKMARRKTRSTKKEPPRDSIRVKLGYGGGPWTLNEARAMMMDALHQMEATGITHIARANLYLSPVDEKGKTVNRVGSTPLPDLDIPRPYRSAAEEHGL